MNDPPVMPLAGKGIKPEEEMKYRQRNSSPQVLPMKSMASEAAKGGFRKGSELETSGGSY